MKYVPSKQKISMNQSPKDFKKFVQANMRHRGEYSGSTQKNNLLIMIPVQTLEVQTTA